MSARTVDVHAHALLPAVEALVAELDPDGLATAKALDGRRNGAESSEESGRMIKQRWQLLTDLPTRLSAMDSTFVDLQVVSPSPSHYYSFLDDANAAEVARAINGAIAHLVAQAPDRLVGLGVAPLQHPGRMVDALGDALERGLIGVEIGSYGQSPTGGQAHTVELSDPALEPFWAAAEAARAVIFVHPFGCSLDERLDRFYLANTVSQPAENAVALSHLIFSGVLDRYPDLVVIAAHGGGYLPTAIGRSDHAWRVRPEARRCAHPPSTYLKRLWFDSLTHDAGQLRELVRVAGADRVLLGSDFPFDRALTTR
ncbi:aminocarboxymuconate-semialdehyde decarboxylase [Rhodococcus erythropolis]|uniref:amidohydrolase family protein n=1 Tax=Rhodococcus erythropolis TaxID=1833 RepID=UPI002168A7F7|nr:amidohydrolase family protein [Rhodococcus erythropolis]MCS4257825.1 aminocarboxymuconate-semialdehyde decarboxylase [Rhodococcus erythropolis]MCW2425127.1 aminocarboxymuconate-semialdehyde decarboxylase [Rhodococcus erythropolis]